MVQKIHPRGVIWVPSNSPHDVHLNWNSGARSLSSSKACPCLALQNAKTEHMEMKITQPIFGILVALTKKRTYQNDMKST